MHEFWRKHDKPNLPEHPTEEDFNSIWYWIDIVKEIPPLIRKIAAYYQIPAEKYPFHVNIVFDEKRWDEWQLVFGHKNRLNNITGGSYYTEKNYIEINPYIYFFEGADAWLEIIYHELAHWVIKQVPYLSEVIAGRDNINEKYHNLDFPMVLNDICSLPDARPWAKYTRWKELIVKEQFDELCPLLEHIRVHLPYGKKVSETYEGEIRIKDDNFSRGF